MLVLAPVLSLFARQATGPTSTSRIRDAAVGALYGFGAACLVAPRLGGRPGWVALGLCLVLGAALALRIPAWPALARPWAAVLTAVVGVALLRSVELAFFLLVPLVAAALAGALVPAANETRPIPRWSAPLLFVAAAAVFFVQSANRHWQFASGSMDLGLFVQQHWLLSRGLVPFNTVMGMHMLADHMDWIDVLVAPLLRLGPGPEMLLLVQSLVVASAVFPLVALGRRLAGEHAGLAAAAAFVLAPDVHMGVMFDYNPSTLGSALLLWAAAAIVLRGPRRRRWLLAARLRGQGELHAVRGDARPHARPDAAHLLAARSHGRRAGPLALRAAARGPVPPLPRGRLPPLGVRGARRDAEGDRRVRRLAPAANRGAARRQRGQAPWPAAPAARHRLPRRGGARDAAAAAAQLGRALPVDPPDALVGLLLRDAGGRAGLPRDARRRGDA